MSVERIAKLERDVQELRSQLRSRDRGTQTPVSTRPAKVVTAATSGATFGIVFLDVDYEKTINSSVASFIPRQAAQAEFCQNICNDGGNPPVNTRLEVFLWNGRWVTWWRPASTSTSEDKSFFYAASPRWTLADPTDEQTSFPDWAVKCGAATWGQDALTFVPATTATYSTTSPIADHDDTETNYDTSGPITILEDGRYEITMSGSFGLVRTTGADTEPGPDKLIKANVMVRYEDPTLVRNVAIGREIIQQVGDSHFDWNTSGMPTGYENVEAHGEFAWHFTYMITLRFYAGYWLTPYVTADGPDDYGLVFNSCHLVLRKLRD